MKISYFCSPLIFTLTAGAIACSLWSGCTDTSDGEPSVAITPVFLSAAQGRVEISQPDTYVNTMSQFDRQSRTGALQPISIEDYLEAMPAHVRAFSESEEKILTDSLATILDRMAVMGLQPPADPATVQFVRTDGQEEGGARAYTRGNSIYICDGLFGDDVEAGFVTHVVAHEMFHLWSRANPDTIRWPTHEALGFFYSPDIEFPASLENRRITNPDDPLVEETIEVQFEGVTTAVYFALIANADYTGGRFFEYLQLMLIDPENGMQHPIESAQGLLEQIGTTTGEILSAEEISAEHFAIGLLEDQPIRDPALIEAVLAPFAR